MKTVDQSVDVMAYRYPRLRLDAKGNPQAGRDPVRFLCDVALRLQSAETGAPRGATFWSAAISIAMEPLASTV